MGVICSHQMLLYMLYSFPGWSIMSWSSPPRSTWERQQPLIHAGWWNLLQHSSSSLTPQSSVEGSDKSVWNHYTTGQHTLSHYSTYTCMYWWNAWKGTNINIMSCHFFLKKLEICGSKLFHFSQSLYFNFFNECSPIWAQGRVTLLSWKWLLVISPPSHAVSWNKNI